MRTSSLLLASSVFWVIRLMNVCASPCFKQVGGGTGPVSRSPAAKKPAAGVPMLKIHWDAITPDKVRLKTV
jgi:hypothetical protein